MAARQGQTMREGLQRSNLAASGRRGRPPVRTPQRCAWLAVATAQGVVVRLTDRRRDVIAVVKAHVKDPSHDIGAQVPAEKMAAHHDEHRPHHTHRWPLR
jgi:hypothetical protein